MTSNGEEQGCKSTLEIPIIHFTVSERERGCDEREETEKIDDENERRRMGKGGELTEVGKSGSHEHEEKDGEDRATELQCPCTTSELTPGAGLGPPLLTAKLTLEPSSQTESTMVSLLPASAFDDSSSSEFQPILKIQKQLHFLVVDDSALNRRMIIKLLGDHTCDQAVDGVEAVAKYTGSVSTDDVPQSEITPPVNSKIYDAILMDFMMPNMDGPTATELIRGMGYTGPVIGITGTYKTFKSR